MIGVIEPVRDAAVAYDGKQAVAMLRYEPQEPVSPILTRLDTAIAMAQASGQRVDGVEQAGRELGLKASTIKAVFK